MFLFSLYTCVCIHVYKMHASYLHWVLELIGNEWVIAGGQQGARKLYVLCVGITAVVLVAGR